MVTWARGIAWIFGDVVLAAGIGAFTAAEEWLDGHIGYAPGWTTSAGLMFGVTYEPFCRLARGL